MTQRTLDESMEELDEKTVPTLLTMKEKVRFIATNYPCTKGDYRLLYFLYIRHFGKGVTVIYKEFSDLRKQPSSESVCRLFRMLQNEDESLRPLERTRRKRARREELIREFGIGD